MRPHELTLRGFRSYRDEVTFDFRGRHLVGIVGPIGAGKSSILDGIAFALFGKTPRVQKETKSLIHQLSDSAHVRLTFEVDGQTWQVTRALKRKGQGQVQLVHLGDGGEAVETVVMERPVRDRIERLLGMDFDTFGRSVLLAQNRFAEFLLASDAPRNAVLKGVFGYERFDAALTAAREHVARREATVAALDADGARLTQARAALEEARTAAADAVARRDRFEALLPRVADLDRHVAAAAEREATAATAAARVERAAAMVPDAATLDDTLTATAGCPRGGGRGLSGRRRRGGRSSGDRGGTRRGHRAHRRPAGLRRSGRPARHPGQSGDDDGRDTDASRARRRDRGHRGCGGARGGCRGARRPVERHRHRRGRGRTARGGRRHAPRGPARGDGGRAPRWSRRERALSRLRPGRHGGPEGRQGRGHQGRRAGARRGGQAARRRRARPRPSGGVGGERRRHRRGNRDRA